MTIPPKKGNEPPLSSNGIIPPPAPTIEEPVAKNNTLRNLAISIVTLIFIGLGILWFLLWFLNWQYYKTTENAYVNGNLINVTSVISGTPIAIFADSTDYVVEGQKLVLLDNTQYKIMYEKELASLIYVVNQVKQLYANVKVSEAMVDSARTKLQLSKYSFENRNKLIQSQAISNEEFMNAKDNLTLAENSLKQAEAQLQAAQDAAGNTVLEKHPMIEQQKAAVRNAFYNLKHCVIYAPLSGFIAQRKVQVGQWVNPASYLMSIVPITNMWVDANFKETELTHIRIGQPATVTFDLYGPDVKFDGKVVGISPGTGSVFSLIPSQNASGNWIKIVQRLPVKIDIDQSKIKEHPLWLGLSARVRIDITNTDLPILETRPANGVVASTAIFDIDMSGIDEIMNKIIKDSSQ